MKSVILAVLALAISSEASYPYAPAPAVEYGVPAETRTILPVAPVVTVRETTKPAAAVSYNYAVSQVHPAPLPAAPVLIDTPSEVHVPSGVTSLVEGRISPLPSLYHNLHSYAATYPIGLPAPIPAPAPAYVLPHEPVRPLAYSYGHGYDYGYSAAIGHPLIYSNPAPVHHVVSAPLPAVTTVVTHHEVPAPEPVIVKYGYELPHETVVVPELPKPIVPHTVYGVPH